MTINFRFGTKERCPRALVSHLCGAFIHRTRVGQAVADVCFKGGYIDSWGRGTLKIINACREAGLPEPSITEQDGDFLVEIFKNRSTPENLKKLGLNERQIKAVEYVAEQGKITNQIYQDLFGVASITATRDLKELVEKKILTSSGTKSAGSSYRLTIAS